MQGRMRRAERERLRSDCVIRVHHSSFTLLMLNIANRLALKEQEIKKENKGSDSVQ